jgi:drug/metabolite transporter (DMT)-like permease
MTRTKTYILLALIGALWGFQPITLKFLLPYWSPATITVFRFMVVGLLILLYQFMASHWQIRQILPAKRDWPWIVFMGINGQMLNSVLQFHGLQFTTVTNSTLITATTPAITAVCAFLILREHFNGKQWLGILLSFIGVLSIITKGDIQVLLTMHFNQGDVFCLLSQLAWAFYSLASRKLTGHLDVLTALGWCSLCGALGTLLFGLCSGTLAITVLPVVPFLSYLYITLFGGIAANVFWNIGVKEVGPSVSSVFLNLTPVVGMFCGWLIFDDPMGLMQLCGAAVIFVGVYLTTHGAEHA